MSRVLATATLVFFVGTASLPALAEVGMPGPEAEPRSYLSPTDESEPVPRVPPVTQPTPMKPTRLG
ncbi:MAG: hypothetical protein F9K44_16930, partial [Hyphomicrobiaceae bacterium]